MSVCRLMEGPPSPEAPPRGQSYVSRVNNVVLCVTLWCVSMLIGPQAKCLAWILTSLDVSLPSVRPSVKFNELFTSIFQGLALIWLVIGHIWVTSCICGLLLEHFPMTDYLNWSSRVIRVACSQLMDALDDWSLLNVLGILPKDSALFFFSSLM